MKKPKKVREGGELADGQEDHGLNMQRLPKSASAENKLVRTDMPQPASSSSKGLEQQVERVNINNKQEHMYEHEPGAGDGGSEIESVEEELETEMDAAKQEMLHNQIAEMPRSAAHM